LVRFEVVRQPDGSFLRLRLIFAVSSPMSYTAFREPLVHRDRRRSRRPPAQPGCAGRFDL
jgi:hypothetical protein